MERGSEDSQEGRAWLAKKGSGDRQTAAANSQIGRAIQQSLMDQEEIFLLEFSRTPVEFHRALLEAPEMVSSAARRKPRAEQLRKSSLALQLYRIRATTAGAVDERGLGSVCGGCRMFYGVFLVLRMFPRRLVQGIL